MLSVIYCFIDAELLLLMNHEINCPLLLKKKEREAIHHPAQRPEWWLRQWLPPSLLSLLLSSPFLGGWDLLPPSNYGFLLLWCCYAGACIDVTAGLISHPLYRRAISVSIFQTIMATLKCCSSTSRKERWLRRH